MTCFAPPDLPAGLGFALKYTLNCPQYCPIHVTMTKKLTPADAVPAAPMPTSFEQAMAELQQLVVQMEAGELPLEASVAAYKRGSVLVQYCAAQLEKIDAQVKVLEGDMLKPFTVEGADLA